VKTSPWLCGPSLAARSASKAAAWSPSTADGRNDGVQDRDAAKPLLWNLKKAFPKIRLTWADGGYAGKLVIWSRTALKLTLEIVKRPDDLHTFKVLPRRWVVERTLAWITRHRRTIRDYERLPAHHETDVYWAMVIVMIRRLARKPEPTGITAEPRITAGQTGGAGFQRPGADRWPMSP
jgi:transposase